MKTIIIVGSEGLIGQALKKQLDQKYKVICIDIKKKKDVNYYSCDLKKNNSFKKILKKIAKKNEIFAAINTIYPVKHSNFLQNNNKKFLNFINYHLISYYNFNNETFKLFSKSKKKKILINFSSIYGEKIPNFNIYKGTKIKMPIEYSIVKSSLIIMSKYFDKWSKFKNKKTRFYCVNPAGVESSQPKKFKSNYRKIYKAKMISTSSIFTCIKKILEGSYKTTKRNIFITGGAKI